MAKAAKKKAPVKRAKRGKYDDKTVVKSSFLDIVKAAVKGADKKKATK
jgi:hypothetical protein